MNIILALIASKTKNAINNFGLLLSRNKVYKSVFCRFWKLSN